MRTRRGDFAMLGYFAVFAAYVVSTILFVFSSFVVFFASMLAAYFFATVCFTCWLYRDVLRRTSGSDSFGWLLGFLLLGGIALPTYYFTGGGGQPSSAVRRIDGLQWIARILATAVLLIGFVRFGWSVAIALTHQGVPETLRTLGIADRVALWTAWIVTLVLLIRQPWATAKKIGWAIGALLGSLILLPIVVFAELEA